MDGRSGKREGGVNFEAISNKAVIDKRYAREASVKVDQGLSSSSSSQPVSSTFDAFKRLAAGLDGKSLADKMNDPNRPTWEQYKKDNEDKLDMVGGDAKKMAEYRIQLDMDRAARLACGNSNINKNVNISDEEEEEEDDNSNDSDDDGNSSKSSSTSSSKEKKKSKKSKKHKKEKKHKKHKKRKKEEVRDKERKKHKHNDDV